MGRHQLIVSTAVGVSLTRMSGLLATDHSHHEDRTFATPEEAGKSPPDHFYPKIAQRGSLTVQNGIRSFETRRV